MILLIRYFALRLSLKPKHACHVHCRKIRDSLRLRLRQVNSSNQNIHWQERFAKESEFLQFTEGRWSLFRNWAEAQLNSANLSEKAQEKGGEHSTLFLKELMVLPNEDVRV